MDGNIEIDWADCPNVERVPGKVSGAWLVKDTRIPADAVVDNAEDGYSAEEIVAEIYPSLPLERAKLILAYAQAKARGATPQQQKEARLRRAEGATLAVLVKNYT